MSTLVLLIPPSLAPAEPAAVASVPAWDWVRSEDGVQITSQGRSPLDALPVANTVVAVVDASLLSWHRIDVPRVPAPRLPAALVAGVLADLTGDYRLGFTLLAILSSLGSLAFMLATRPGQDEAEQASVS
jgi:general secretion pathway protein L